MWVEDFVYSYSSANTNKNLTKLKSPIENYQNSITEKALCIITENSEGVKTQ